VTALVAVETLLLLLLAVLVAGLLRSHAEILRRLGPPDAERDQLDPALASPRSAPRLDAPAPDIAGTTLDGRVVQFGLRRGGESTLLAFLSSGCLVCERFWEAFQPRRRPEVPGGGRLVIVTKDPSHESPSKLRQLAPPDVALVMSSAAWEDYEVPTAPYFVHVDGESGQVGGEGAAAGWDQVVSLLRDALEDAAGGGNRGGSARARRVDADLEAAGIGPGHPSLYPTGPVDGES
jgi:hypothetical protein